jgi:pyridinium-3,5-bisthiocarboxylic acid mononucleotide nickel chelatase
MEIKMKNVLYLDCFSGISGDMTIGALIDAGLDFAYLSKELEKLGLKGYRLNCREVMAGVVSAIKFDVEIIEEQKSRSHNDIKKIIAQSNLSNKVKEVSLDLFKCVASAEARIHNQSIDEVHFHEVGAIDSIIDITGTAIGMEYLKIDRIYCSHIPLGSGNIETSHGKLPIPAPATLEILKGVPVYQGDFDFEVTTPTGAAIVKTLVSDFRKMTDIKIKSNGYGAGTKNVTIDQKNHPHNHGLPNVLRVVLGKEAISAANSNARRSTLDKIFHTGDTIMLSTNIDDSTPEIMGYILERLNTGKGVLDAWVQSIYMKKNRPAFKLNIICVSKEENNIVEMIFRETSTLGIRRETIDRYCLDREKQLLKIPYGEIEIKGAKLYGDIVNSSPEYESCKKLAKKTGKPLKDIYRDIVLFLSET